MSVAEREPTFVERPDLPGIEAFETGKLDPEAFDHEAHVYVAWLLLGQGDLPEATGRFTSGLRRLTRQWGVEDKYHETITVFFMALIAERLAARPAATWPSFRAENPDLVEAPGELLAAHYSGRRLDSSLARQQFLLPDRAPEEGCSGH